MKFFKKIKARLRYDAAVKKAEKAHITDGTRYYVMPSTTRGKLLIMNRKSFRELKRKHYINNSYKIRDVEKVCFYFTANRAGECAHPLLVEKGRKRFISWCLTDKKSKDA